jgi:hypothetical protein
MAAAKAQFFLDYVNSVPPSYDPVTKTHYAPIQAEWSWGGQFLTKGVQTTPGLARGALLNTGVYITNSQVAHVCDFTFNLNTDFSLTALVPNLGLITGAIKNGKNAAANIMRAAIAQLNRIFRIAIDVLLGALNFDATGTLSFAFSALKNIARKINEKLEEAAQIIADIAMVYYLIEELKQIEEWINSLEDRVRKILLNCLFNFQKVGESVSKQFQTSLAAAQAAATVKLETEEQAPQANTTEVDNFINSLVKEPKNLDVAEVTGQIDSVVAEAQVATADVSFADKKDNSESV